MPPITASDALINVDNETTQGTAVDPTKHIGKIIGSVDVPDPEYSYEEDYYVGDGRLPSDKFKGQESLEDGSMTIEPVDGYPLALLFGEEDFDDTTTPNTHTMTLNDQAQSLPPSVSMGVGYDGGFDRIFNGVVFGSGNITVSEDEKLQMDVSYSALGVEKNGTWTKNQDVPDRPIWSFNNVSSNLSFAGITFARLQDFDLEIEQNVSVDYYVEDGDGAFEITYGRPTITLNATITVTDASIWDELTSDTSFSTSIAFSKSDADLTIDLADCDIRSAPHGIPEEGKEEVEVELAAESVTATVEDQESTSAYLA